jgi:hypothetical protein
MNDNITNTNTNTKTTSMTHQSSCKSHEQIDQELKKPHQHKNKEQQQKQETTIVEAAEEVVIMSNVTEEEESGRERLKRHRDEMGGNVWIPDLWGQEEFLKDWIDCTKFDPPLISSNKIVTARTALVQEATGGGTAGFRFHYSC